MRRTSKLRVSTLLLSLVIQILGSLLLWLSCLPIAVQTHAATSITPTPGAGSLGTTVTQNGNVYGITAGAIDSATYYPSANLFLMSPAGFLFAPNATVNVGSMVAFTTADYLRFRGPDTLFNNALIPESLSPVSIGPAAAFGFLGSNPAAIVIQGSTLQDTHGMNLTFKGGGDEKVYMACCCSNIVFGWLH